MVDADVRWLLDRAQIRELTARYNRAFDDGDPESFAATFTEDGVMAVEGTFSVDGPPSAGRDGQAHPLRRGPRHRGRHRRGRRGPAPSRT